jgi:hypothetical protein
MTNATKMLLQMTSGSLQLESMSVTQMEAELSRSRLRRTRMGRRFDVLLSISSKTRLAVIEVGGLGLAPLMHPSKIAAHFFAIEDHLEEERRRQRLAPLQTMTIYRRNDLPASGSIVIQ